MTLYLTLSKDHTNFNMYGIHESLEQCREVAESFNARGWSVPGSWRFGRVSWEESRYYNDPHTCLTHPNMQSLGK